MAKVSVLIPSRNERFLPQTINDVLTKATGDVECIVILEGYWPDPPLQDRPNLILIHRGQAMGMRAAINGAASIAHGEYLLKCDAHCMFAQGYDEVLQKDIEDNWIVIPRRYSLDPEAWTIAQNGKSPIDYHYLSCPIWSERERDDYSMHGAEWNERSRQRRDKPEFDVDEQMSFQGSCWFMTATHFHEHLGGMSEVGYGSFTQEPQEIGNKTWLGPWDGRVMVNKKTYYCHLHKGKQYGRGYPLSTNELRKGHEYAGVYWMKNQWPERAHNIEWLIDRFWPVPTWPDDWKEINKTDFGPGSVHKK